MDFNEVKINININNKNLKESLFFLARTISKIYNLIIPITSILIETNSSKFSKEDIDNFKNSIKKTINLINEEPIRGLEEFNNCLELYLNKLYELIKNS